MISIKTKIAHFFDKSCLSYERVAEVQSKSAAFLVRKLWQFDANFRPQHILDLGSGTGYMPEKLLKYYPHSFYQLNDISSEMLIKSQQKFKHLPHFQFCRGDMESLNFAPHCLITSNFALQWVNDFWAVIEKFYHLSKIFAFSILLEGTFEEWQNLLEVYGLELGVKKYPQEKAVMAFCKNLLGLEKGLDSDRFYSFQQKEFKLKFLNVWAFLQYLKNLGAQGNKNKGTLSSLRQLIRTHSHEFSVTYKVLFVILKKP